MFNRLFESEFDVVILRALALFGALERVEIGLPDNRLCVTVGFFDIEKYIEQGLFLFERIALVLDKCLNRVFKLTV